VSPPARGPSFVARIGLAITQPRWALSLGADRDLAGRSGSDLIALIGLLLLATQLRGLFASAWLGTAVDASLGLRAAMQVLTRTLTVDLGFLVVAAFLLFAAAGAKRNLGRAFDLACVAAIPLVLVDLTATTVVRAFDLSVPPAAQLALTGASFAWAGALLALALRPARSSASSIPDPPAADIARARFAGWAVIGVAVLGTAVQIRSITGNLELIRPMTKGDEAPGFALPSIGKDGVLGAPVGLAEARGKIVVLDFWATWCGPCIAAMPGLAALAREHAAEVEVIAINLDDAAEARAIFDRSGYQMRLVADDGTISQRYGVTTIPHTVVIDRAGIVRSVHRGGGKAAEHEVERMLDAEIAK